MARIRISFADLRRSFGEFYVRTWIETNEGLQREVVVAVDEFEDEPVHPWAGRASMFNAHEEQIPCPVHHSIDYLNNVGLQARDPFDCPLAAELRSAGARNLA